MTRPAAASCERILQVRLGLHIGYWGSGMTAEEQLDLVLEARGSATTRSGPPRPTAPTPPRSSPGSRRPPRDQARLGDLPDARPLGRDDRDDGRDDRPALRRRMLLGIGTSGPQVAEGWHGQRFGKQLQRTREYIAVVRMALARERVVFKGETLELPLPDGPGKALKLTIAPVQERMPIYWPRSGRRTRPWARRSPTAGSRRCSRPSTSASSARCSRRASPAPAAARASTTSTSRPPST